MAVTGRSLGVTLAVLFGMGTPAGAQQHPVFAGEWVRVPDSTATGPSVAATGDASFRRGDMGVGWGSPLSIAQTPDSLSVEFPYFSAYDVQPPLRFRYALDGSETRHELMIGHAATPHRSRVSWQGASLVITTIHAAPAPAGGRPGTVVVRQSLTLAAPDRLVIEATHGDAADTVRAVYRRR